MRGTASEGRSTQSRQRRDAHPAPVRERPSPRRLRRGMAKTNRRTISSYPSAVSSEHRLNQLVALRTPPAVAYLSHEANSATTTAAFRVTSAAGAPEGARRGSAEVVRDVSSQVWRQGRRGPTLRMRCCALAAWNRWRSSRRSAQSGVACARHAARSAGCDPRTCVAPTPWRAGGVTAGRSGDRGARGAARSTRPGEPSWARTRSWNVSDGSASPR